MKTKQPVDHEKWDDDVEKPNEHQLVNTPTESDYNHSKERINSDLPLSYEQIIASKRDEKYPDLLPHSADRWNISEFKHANLLSFKEIRVLMKLEQQGLTRSCIKWNEWTIFEWTNYFSPSDLCKFHVCTCRAAGGQVDGDEGDGEEFFPSFEVAAFNWLQFDWSKAAVNSSGGLRMTNLARLFTGR